MVVLRVGCVLSSNFPPKPGDLCTKDCGWLTVLCKHQRSAGNKELCILGRRKSTAQSGLLGISQQPVIFPLSSFPELQKKKERHLPARGWPLKGKQRASMELGEPLSLLSPVSCSACPGGCCFSSPINLGYFWDWGHIEI